HHRLHRQPGETSHHAMKSRNFGVRAFLIGTLILAGVAAGCDSTSSSSTGAPVVTTTAPPKKGSAEITSFVVPDSGAWNQATYARSGAQSVDALVDGRLEPLNGSAGQYNAPVHCDGLPHTLVLVAYDAHGGQTSLSKIVTTKS